MWAPSIRQVQQNDDTEIGKVTEERLARDVSHSGHWGNGDYELTVADTANLEYIMSLVKQTLTHV